MASCQQLLASLRLAAVINTISMQQSDIIVMMMRSLLLVILSTVVCSVQSRKASIKFISGPEVVADLGRNYFVAFEDFFETIYSQEEVPTWCAR